MTKRLAINMAIRPSGQWGRRRPLGEFCAMSRTAVGSEHIGLLADNTLSDRGVHLRRTGHPDPDRGMPRQILRRKIVDVDSGSHRLVRGLQGRDIFVPDELDASGFIA